VIDQPPVGVERLEDRVEHVPEVRDRLGTRRQPRRRLAVLAQVRPQPRQRPPGARHRDQLRRLERRRLADPRDRRRDVRDPAERQRRVARRQRPRLGDLRRAIPRLVERGEQLRRADVRRAAPGRAAPRPVVDQRRPAEIVERLRRDHDGRNA